MLKKLDELEEHPNFYIRTEEQIILNSQDQNISETILNQVFVFDCFYKIFFIINKSN